ncbi:MAG: glucokinase [Brevefilum sp.]|nr:glucokinase [Brevefilum sp.]
MTAYFLAGDIGGTKTVLSLFEEGSGPNIPLEKETFASRNFRSLSDIVVAYLSKRSVAVRVASFGVAGPVKDGQVETTNLPWSLTESALRPVVNDAPVFLLNDLMAAAQAIPYLTRDDLFTINPGVPDPHGAIGLISPGTGLGEAFLTWDGEGYQAHPSEGGHSSFAPTDENQFELLDFLLPQFGHVSYERVCSGNGIANLYAFMKEVKKIAEPESLNKALKAAPDPNPVLFRAALQDRVEIATYTLELFTDILANEASNLALKVLATGGIYLGGGIPPRLKDWLDPDRFMRAFIYKGRFTDLLAAIPIHIIVRPETALFGAACFAFERYKLLSKL